MTDLSKESLVNRFPKLEINVFKRKIYDACISYAMENYKILQTNYSIDKFPADSYHTIDDQIKLSKSDSSLLPKKKKSNDKKTPTIDDTPDDSKVANDNISNQKPELVDKKKSISDPALNSQ